MQLTLMIQLENSVFYLYNSSCLCKLDHHGGAVLTLKRVLAILALIIIAILLILLLFFAFTGAKKEYLLAVLFCLIVIPSVLYVFIWFTKLTKK